MNSRDAILRMLNNLKGSANPNTALNSAGQVYPDVATKFPDYGKGNINLNNRPIVPNGNGYSTVNSYSFTLPDSNKVVLLPSVIKGINRVLTPDETWQHYSATGEHLGIFNSEQEANIYAQSLHENQAKMYDQEYQRRKLLPDWNIDKSQYYKKDIINVKQMPLASKRTVIKPQDRFGPVRFGVKANLKKI